MACRFVTREAMRTRSLLEVEVSMNGVDEGTIAKGPTGLVVTAGENVAPVVIET